MTRTRSGVMRTRSGKIIDNQIQSPQGHDTCKTAKAGQRSINRSTLSKGHPEDSDSANGSTIATGASTSEDAVEDAANLEASAPEDSAPAESVINASPTSQDAPPPIAQPTSSAATIDATSVSRMASEAIGLMSTITSTQSETDAIGIASSQGSNSRPVATAQSISSTAVNPQPVAELKPRRTNRKSQRHATKIRVESLIVTPNTSDDPIIIDDDAGNSEADTPVSSTPNRSLGTDELRVAHSIKQVLQYRQRHIERMKSHLDNMLAHVGSTVDSDQSGDFDSMGVGEKRSFQDFLLDEIDDMDQPRKFADDFLDEVRKYQGLLRRTKDFHYQ